MMAIGDGAYLFSLPLRKLFTNCKRTHSSCSRPQKAHSSLSLSSVAGRHCGRRPNLNQTLPPAAPDVLYYKRYISAVNISLTKPWVLAPRHYDRNLAIIVIPWPRDMYHNNAQTPRVHNRVHVYLLLVPVRIYNFYLSSIQRFCNCFRTALLHPRPEIIGAATVMMIRNRCQWSTIVVCFCLLDFHCHTTNISAASGQWIGFSYSNDIQLLPCGISSKINHNNITLS